MIALCEEVSLLVLPETSARLGVSYPFVTCAESIREESASGRLLLVFDAQSVLVFFDICVPRFSALFACQEQASRTFLSLGAPAPLSSPSSTERDEKEMRSHHD